jgi:hypothetical protein
MARRRRPPPSKAEIALLGSRAYWERDLREAQKQRGTTSVPRRSRVPKRPSDEARVWAAEQMIMPWEAERALRAVPKPPKRPRTFAEARKPTAQEQRLARERLDKQRVRWARESLLDREARKKLVQTATPERQLEMLRGPRATGRVLGPKEFQREVAAGRIERELAKPARTRAERERQAQLRRYLELRPWEPSAARRALYGAAGLAQRGVGGLGDFLLTDEQRSELTEYFGEVMADVETASEAIERITQPPAASRRAMRRAGFAGEVSLPVARILGASVGEIGKTAVGVGPGLAYAVAKPEEALASYEQYLKSYYGTLARGDVSPLYRQGITPALLDIGGVAGTVAGGAARAGAVARTLRYPGELRISSEGRRIGRAEALARAAALRQEPTPIYGTDVTTMARPTPQRFVGREEPVAAGQRIEAGDRIEYRRPGREEIDWVVAREENGLVGLETPDVNNPVRATVRGEDVDLLTSYRVGEFAQRMVPRSVFGQFLSDIGWRTRERVSTLRGRGVLTGKGARRKRLRQAAEVRLDRQQGAIKAFATEHRRIQKDVVQATAYDRMLRYADPAAGVEREIVLRRQRGLDQTPEQRQVLAALEQAREIVANPSEALQQAVVAGRALSIDTEQFLIARGLLTQERADTAKLAAERWLREGHIEDEPLVGPRRAEVERELLDHFAGNEEATRLAMAYTDTLARAWGAQERRNPADWYEENIRSVESLTPEQMAMLDERENLLAQVRETRRTPNFGEVFPFRDPDTGVVRVARFVEHVDEDTARIEWVREPNAGQRIDVPLESVKGNTSQIRGWYSGIANEIEKLPDRVSRAEATSRLQKAPGVKKDEWKWLGMDAALDRLFVPGVKSVSRDDLKRAINRWVLQFETIRLSRDEAYYETSYDVTLPGPRSDYHETLIFWPERWVERGEDYDTYDLMEQWEEDIRSQLEEGLIDEDEAAERLSAGPYPGELEDYIPEQEPALYTAPHFDERPGYGYSEGEESYAGNLLAHLRQSERWLGGAPIRVIEEAQSDWHQAGRRGYRTEEGIRAAREAEERASYTREQANEARKTYLSAFVKKLADGDIHVRSLISGEEGLVHRDQWGETPQFRIIIQEPSTFHPRELEVQLREGTLSQEEYTAALETWSAMGRSERRNIREIEPTSDPELRDLFEAMRERDAEDTDAQAIARQRSREAGGPPEAPWAGEKWEELLFREAVRQAVASGETRIAWTTGAQQAERYNMLLAQNVRRMEYDGTNLRVVDRNGDTRSFDADTPDRLTDLVGTGLASRLTRELGEQEIRHDVFRVDRPTGGGATETLMLPIEDTRAGDVVWVGYPSGEDWLRRPQAFYTRETEDGKTRYFVTSYLDEDWAYADRFPKTERWEGAEFARIARGIQRDQYNEFGDSRREPAVLEGEDISIGGGGFIDAYDRRMRSYAKKYLGAEPRLVPLDDISYDYVSPPGDLGMYVFRVKAGDTVLAESESLQAALRAAYAGGKDAGIWPSRIRYVERQGDVPGGYAHFTYGGTPGSIAPSWERQGPRLFETDREAVRVLEEGYDYDWISDFDNAAVRVEGAGPVWVVEIPEKFATEMHEKGSPLFQRRRGSVLGLTRLTDEGADIYLDRDAADMATWIEEAAHAVIPKWFDDADAVGDGRADVLRGHLGIEPGGEITAAANEKMVRLLQTWLDAGAIPSPQLRTLFEGLDDSMREAYRAGPRSIATNPEEAKEFQRLLRNPLVTSFLRDQFDVAPVRDFEPDLVAFQTMQPLERIAGRRAAGGRLMGPVRSVLPSRKKMAGKPNTMQAWESGNFDVGPEVTAHYANAELRTRIQDEQARRVRDKYMEPIEVRNGVPVLKPGYKVFNYYGIRGAETRIDQMFRRSQRYGDITDSEEQMLSADPVTGSIVDMDPEDFGDMVGMTVGKILADEMIFDSVNEAAAKTPRFLELLADGKVGQVPDDVVEAFLNSSGATYASGAIGNIVKTIGTVLAIPNMLARWRMILKIGYPLLNTGATAFLVGMNQGPLLALSIRRTLSLSRPTRQRLMQEVGFGVAELTDVPPITGASWLQRFRAGEQQAFRKWMTIMSTPEAHVRLLQMDNDLARAGLRSETDIVRVLDLAKEGDPNAVAFLDQIGRHAEDAVIRFRGMSVEEQLVVRDAIFVYGWLRAATRYTLQFPLNRPVTADVLFHLGQYGWEKLQDEFQGLAWEQTGAIPIGQRKTAGDFLRKLLDVSQLFPFKSGMELLRPVFQILGLQDTGLRPASFADLLSPSAEFALRGVYGQDPRYATNFWEGVKQDFDPRNLPLVFWAARLWDPSLTGTKLRADRDRWNIVLNFMFGQAAPYEVKETESYERWLDQQPTDIRVLIREQNNATQLAEFLGAAAKVQGTTPTQQQITAINADSAYTIYASLLQTKFRREGKIESDQYLTSVQRAAVKARTLQHYYPDLYAQTLQATSGLDPVGNEDDAENYVDIWDEAWSTVSDELSDVRDQIETTFGWERVPERSRFPFKRGQRSLQWLQTAPPEAVERIRERVAREGIEEERFLYPIIEEEMLRSVRP